MLSKHPVDFVSLCLALFLAGLLPQSFAQTTTATSPGHPCEQDSAYHKLDFLVGHWDVFNADGSKDGTNDIEKVLNGCSIIENWHDVTGGEGKSLFYYQKATKQWKQVWVTDVGPMKEKKMVEELKDGGVRFQGEIPHLNGGSHLDRTTLTPLPQDRVRQVIEISKDDGKTWEKVYDAEYRRKP
jgi:hypothetical protein